MKHHQKKYTQLIILSICTCLSLIGSDWGVAKFTSPINQRGYSGSVFAQTAEETIANQVYKKANCAVVTIKSGGGHGSGFLVNSDGLIITNAHVLQNGVDVVTVKFANGTQVSGDVIGYAKNGLDLAAVKIPKQSNLCKLSLANSRSIQVGYNVFAIGTPLDPKYQNTFTTGQISRIDQKDGTIQHTAFIKHGNSGGPLLNSQAQLIGVNTRIALDIVHSGLGRGGKINAVGIGFAIPIDTIQSFINALNRGDFSNVSTLVTKEENKVEALSLNGKKINGMLTKDYNGKVYVFKGNSKQKITVEMDSNDFDPNLILYKVIPLPNNEFEYKEITKSRDKGPGDLNAILNTTIPDDGEYLILATSKMQRGTGNFTLKADSN